MLVIIQARSNSKRLKNKILKLIFGKPMIWHVIQRIKKAKKVKKIIVATSSNKTDDKLVEYLIKNNFNYYRGSLNNVAERMNKASNKAKHFLRISGDSPLIDSRIIDKAISIYQKKRNYDLITNIFPRTYPKGQSVEIIKSSILKKYIKFMNKYELEHVTKYFYKNNKKFKIKNFKSKKLKNKIQLSVDNIKDLNFLKMKDKKKFLEII